MKKRVEIDPAVCTADYWECPLFSELPQLSRYEGAAFVAFVLALVVVRAYGRRANARALDSARARVVDMGALNRVVTFKEVFLAYLGAGMLEPLLTMASADALTAKDALVNTLQLLGLCVWIYLLSDAFDTSDVVQAFVYRGFRGGDEKTPPWLELARASAARRAERGDLVGALERDAALWFMLAGIFAAHCGIVQHRDVIHSYCVTLLWLALHHQARRATAWGAGYATTLLTPSAALMPLEYCLNLADPERIEDLDALARWRAFIAEECGVELTIRA